MNLSEFQNSIRFNFFPVDFEDHESICDLFDEIDELFQLGEIRTPNKLASGGIDPAFTPEAISKYAKAVKSDEEADKFLEQWHYRNDQHDNMDF